MPKFRRILVVLISLGGGTICPGQNITVIGPVPELKIVKGVPFSAQLRSETTQVLPDGNRVTRTTTAFIARDNEGRTRREPTGSTGLPNVVFINDPVGSTAYVLESGIARKFTSSRSDIPARIDGLSGRSRVAPSKGPTVKTEALGTSVVEGLLVDGTRLTRSILMGEAGNERPFEVVSETWYSEELQTFVMGRSNDPRVGEMTYKLTDVQRGEPSHTLFEVPADYLIQDEPAVLDSTRAIKR